MGVRMNSIFKDKGKWEYLLVEASPYPFGDKLISIYSNPILFMSKILLLFDNRFGVFVNG